MAEESPRPMLRDSLDANYDLDESRCDPPDTQLSPGIPAAEDYPSTFSDILSEYYKKRNAEMAALEADPKFQARCARARAALRRMEERFPPAPADDGMIIDDELSDEPGGNTITPPRSPHPEEDYGLGIFRYSPLD